VTPESKSSSMPELTEHIRSQIDWPTILARLEVARDELQQELDDLDREIEIVRELRDA
jgi:hypothetical protein